MQFQYTYEDWKEGRILWNSILSHTFDSDYISEECQIKIEKDQRLIFKDMAKHTEKSVHQTFIKDYRSSKEINSIARRWFETIDNLFSGDLNSFEETEIVDLEQGLTETQVNIDVVCVIPPVGSIQFNKRLIQLIREAKEEYENTHTWNHNFVQTPIINDLRNHQDFLAELYANAYTNFSKRLRRYGGMTTNTFGSGYEEFSLRRFKVDLSKAGFIDSRIDTELFVKIFDEYLLLQTERMNWLESLDSLHYLIDSLSLTTPEGIGVWDTVSNCFIIKGKEIDSDNLRKANRCSTALSQKLTQCLQSLVE